MTAVPHALLSEISSDDARLDALEATDAATDTRLDTLEDRTLRVTAKQYGAYGLGLVDERTQLQAGLNAAQGGIFEVGAGVYLYTGQLTVPTTTTVVVHKSAIFKPAGLTTGGAVHFGSSPYTPPGGLPLAANATEGALTVTMAAADVGTFAAGDPVAISDATPTGPGAGQVTQEVNYVQAASSTTLTLRYPLNFSYATAQTALVAKFPSGRAVDSHWYGGKFDMAAVSDAGTSNPDHSTFNLWACEHSSVNGVTVYNHAYKLAQVHKSHDCHVRDSIAYSPTAATAGRGYNATLSFCRHSSLVGLWGMNVRHTADIYGGSDCVINRCFAFGRTSDPSQAAFFLHGGLSKRCRVTDSIANNVVTAFGAGNGTFAGDFDFQADVTAQGCDDSVVVSQGCSGFNVTAKCIKSTIRAAVISNSDGVIDVDADGILTNPSNYSAVMVDGTSNVTGRVKVRNALYRALSIAGSGTTDLLLDIDQPDGADTAMRATALTSTSVVRLRGSVTIRDTSAADSAVWATVPAGAVLDADLALSGSGLRAVLLDGASTDQTVRGSIRGTFSDQIRLSGGELIVDDMRFAASGSCVNAATGAVKVTIGPGVSYGDGHRRRQRPERQSGDRPGAVGLVGLHARVADQPEAHDPPERTDPQRRGQPQHHGRARRREIQDHPHRRQHGRPVDAGRRRGSAEEPRAEPVGRGRL
jgi:hypothetical protein